MSGLSDYTAQNELNFITGQKAQPALQTMYLALFTAVGTDSGGFTEVAGNGYARVQVSGTIATNGTTASGNAVLHFAAVPAWIVTGMAILDATTPASITAGTTVLSTTGTTVTMSANAAGTVGNGDSIVFSAFNPAAGSQPSTDTNNAVITFAQATGAGFGTVIAWGLYDALSSGNLWLWDFLGNFAWIPTSANSASPGVFTNHAHGYSNNDPIVCSIEFGGTFPTVTQGTLTGYTVNYVSSVATDTFQLTTVAGGGQNINTSATGAVMVRKLTQQSIPANVTASFAASAFTLSAA
jgi:hypothetical protein